MNLQRDNIKAGVFVLVGIALAVVVIFLLSDFGRLFERSQEVRVYYQLGDGVRGLKVGDLVTLGGQPVGSVRRITDVTETDAPHRVVGKLVHFQMPSRLQLYWNAQIELDKPPIGAGTRLNIRSVGHDALYDVNRAMPIEVLAGMNLPQPLVEVLRDNLPEGALVGDVARNDITEAFARDMGIGDLQREQIQSIIGSVARIARDIEDDVPAITGQLRQRLPELTDRVNNLLDEGRELMPIARQTLEHLRDGSSHARQVLADFDERSDKWLDQADQILADVSAITGNVRTLIREVDPKVQTLVSNMRDISQTLKDHTLEDVGKTLAAAQEGVLSLRDAADRIASALASQTPVVERTLANLQITADQLKLASIEIRRSPWRLLYRPTKRELETDNLYDATRSFALAASALRGTAESLNALVVARPQDDEQLRAKLEHLDAIFNRYQEAEARFWQELEKHKR